MIEYFRRMFSSMNERSSGTDSSKSFLSNDVLKVLLTKLKDTFALKSQLTSLQKRVGQLEKTVGELETDLKDAVYYRE